MPALPDDQFATGDPLLASFVDDLRVVAGGPAPEPRPGLLAAMSQGATVPTASTTGRKRKMPVKTVLGGLAARVALGLGVAAASVTAAGAAGVLPEPAQQAVATVVGAATPFQLPDPSSVGVLAGDEGPTTTSTTPTTVAGDDEVGEEAGERKANHGACVSAVARDKSGSGSEPHGKTVSSVARSDCGKADTTRSTTVGGSSTTSSSTTSTTSTTVADGDLSANSNRGRGNGNSGNTGSGNSGSRSANSGSGNSGRN